MAIVVAPIVRAGVGADAKMNRANMGADPDAPGIGRASAKQAQGQDRSDKEFHGSLQG